MTTPRPKRASVSVTPRVDALWGCVFPDQHTAGMTAYEMARELETDNTALRKQVASLRRAKADLTETVAALRALSRRRPGQVIPFRMRMAARR